MMAISSGHKEVAKLLLEYGIDACAKDIRGRDARSIAVRKGRHDMLELLPKC
jgi:ankyrin repeat protein